MFKVSCLLSDQRSLKQYTSKMPKKHSVMKSSPLVPSKPGPCKLGPNQDPSPWLEADTALAHWGTLTEDPTESMAEIGLALALHKARRLAEAQTPAGIAAATAQQRSIFNSFLLQHIQHNISRAKVTQGLKHIKPCWQLLHRNQSDRAADDQDRLNASDDDMWAWVHAQPEYINMTEQEFEALGNGFSEYWEEKYAAWVLTTIPKDPHRDAEGNIEACRYFNTSVGCHPPEGQKCPYRHVLGKAPEAEECKFFSTPRGCKNGDKCPFKHTTASAASTASTASLDFAAARAGGGSWRQPAAAAVAAVAAPAADGWELAGAKPFKCPSRASSAAAQEPCKFFRSKKGCRSGSSCPYPHV